MSWNDEDNKNIRGPKDRSKISFDEQYEIDYWCNYFNVSESKLRIAVDKVGNSVVKVKEYFGKK
ncbi:MAG: DUF3606 domain-containing protein [Spirochaetes bacterium]|nr:DUF3606 domain-containing protein [Spirochaetota bacterium]